MGKAKVKLGIVKGLPDLLANKELIDESLINVCAAWDLYGEKNGEVTKEFYSALHKLGWRDSTHGVNKVVYYKGDMMLKFAHVQTDNEYEQSGLDTEWRIWRRAKGKKKLHLAECVFYYRWRLLFQKRVPFKCYEWRVIRNKKGEVVDLKECKTAKKLAHRYRIFDWSHNHGHLANKRTVFYDYDNHGYGWDAWKQRRADGSNH